MNESTGFVLPSKVYDFLKFVALVLLPALGTLYFALAGTWGLPNAEQVVGTITAIDTLLGVLLKASTSAFNKSPAAFDGHISIMVDPSTERTSFRLELNDDPESLIGMDKVSFSVGKPVVPR